MTADALPRGNSFDDLAAFLRAGDGHPVQEVRECVCRGCGVREFGLRCLDCGGMGVYEDWKIGYGPSLHLLDQV